MESGSEAVVPSNDSLQTTPGLLGDQTACLQPTTAIEHVPTQVDDSSHVQNDTPVTACVSPTDPITMRVGQSGVEVPMTQPSRVELTDSAPGEFVTSGDSFNNASSHSESSETIPAKSIDHGCDTSNSSIPDIQPIVPPTNSHSMVTRSKRMVRAVIATCIS
ncbi:hypothetical protein V6N11_044275 [Hibiscus sabdariffa]|uniref:Uncharacterized protein n=1 Tax=Hibiscus sabdariffa TaxID=183260 RepID=A0ABR2RFB0_9ROSI